MMAYVVKRNAFVASYRFWNSFILGREWTVWAPSSVRASIGSSFLKLMQVLYLFKLRTFFVTSYIKVIVICLICNLSENPENLTCALGLIISKLPTIKWRHYSSFSLDLCQAAAARFCRFYVQIKHYCCVVSCYYFQANTWLLLDNLA